MQKKCTFFVLHHFRNYLHYHIKCSKAYIHSRMRAKTAAFLKVLNRAKPGEAAKPYSISLPKYIFNRWIFQIPESKSNPINVPAGAPKPHILLGAAQQNI